MSKSSSVVLWLLASILLVTIQADAQGIFGRPLFGFQQQATMMRFANTACRGDGNESGTCLSSSECDRKGGTNSGSCANGAGTCCSFKLWGNEIIIVANLNGTSKSLTNSKTYLTTKSQHTTQFTCGGTTSQNETIFVNPQYPNGENGTYTCQVTIEKSPNVCQLRLDFDEFKLAQPDENGLCTTDSFMVRTTVGERLPILCGDNAKQHIYIDMGRGSANPVVLSVVSNGDKLSRKWKIRINMIPCNSLDMAPSGCLTYYRSPSSVIRSFNFGPKIDGRARYLSNLRYTSCIRVEENFCAIKWETEQPTSFSFGTPFEGNVTELGGSAGGLCNNDDFIGIDQGSADGVGPGEDRFCGTRLLDSNTIISRSKPFQLKVRSNVDQTQNALNSQIGFAMRYVQLPCVM